MKDKINVLVKEKFIEINNSLFISEEDNAILRIAQILDIGSELISAQNNNNDFFTFFTIQESYDIDLLIFFYVGKTNDSGFICLYVPDLLTKKTNLLAVLSLIFSKQPLFDKSVIIDAIIIDVLSKMNKAITYPIRCRVVRTKREIFFELFNEIQANNNIIN